MCVCMLCMHVLWMCGVEARLSLRVSSIASHPVFVMGSTRTWLSWIELAGGLSPPPLLWGYNTCHCPWLFTWDMESQTRVLRLTWQMLSLPTSRTTAFKPSPKLSSFQTFSQNITASPDEAYTAWDLYEICNLWT